jgi:hypothetical protein
MSLSSVVNSLRSWLPHAGAKAGSRELLTSSNAAGSSNGRSYSIDSGARHARLGGRLAERPVSTNSPADNCHRMMKVLATSKHPAERDAVKAQLDNARRALSPKDAAELDDVIATYFDAETNLQHALERYCKVLALEQSQPESSGADEALSRIEELLERMNAPRKSWWPSVIKQMMRASLRLPEEVLGSLMPTIEKGASEERRRDGPIDRKFLMAALAETQDEDRRITMSGREGRIADIASLVRGAGGPDAAQSDLVQRQFENFTHLVRRAFEETQRKQSEGTLLEAKELEQLLWLNGVLARVALPESGPDADNRRNLLTSDEQDDIDTWLCALRPNPDSVARANGDEPIVYDLADIRQYRPNACGDACVQTLLRYHDLSHDEYGTNGRPVLAGLDRPGLLQPLSEQGIATMNLLPQTFRQVSKDELRRWLAQHGPLVAITSDHCLLIIGIEGDTVTIHCPLLGRRQGSVDALNRYLEWSVTPSPILATYKAGQPKSLFQHQPKPGRVSRLAARLIVGGWEQLSTREWRAVKKPKR